MYVCMYIYIYIYSLDLATANPQFHRACMIYMESSSPARHGATWIMGQQVTTSLQKAQSGHLDPESGALHFERVAEENPRLSPTDARLSLQTSKR